MTNMITACVPIRSFSIAVRDTDLEPGLFQVFSVLPNPDPGDAQDQHAQAEAETGTLAETFRNIRLLSSERTPTPSSSYMIEYPSGDLLGQCDPGHLRTVPIGVVQQDM